ncbi:MAG: protein kinase [Gemmatimonadaceae bacterium]
MIQRVQAGLGDRYDLIREIGAGGMAIVYLAIDRRHARQVAIKVLRPELAAAIGAERFLREIGVVASFEHPHIASLYDSGESDGLPYYVMPFIEGMSLEALIRRDKQLAIDDVVELTRQIASALDYSHARGIVHRDIKPQNILMSSGQALVADFGIARAIATAGNERLTSTGLAVGSVHYMSPEQASGREDVDHRSDIYSLGCVAYEMLVGEPPFRGRTPQAVMARHSLEPVPDIRIVRSTISLETQEVLKKALAKVPADRFRSASEFATALKLSVDHPPVPPPPPAPWHSRRVATLAGLGIVVGILVVVATTPILRSRDVDPRVVTFNVPPPSGVQFTDDLRDVSAVSPDGRDIAFVGTDSSGMVNLWLQPLAERAAHRIRGTDFGSKAFWSHDGKSIGFFQGRSLAVVDRSGGASRTLVATSSDPQGGSWADNGTILYAPGMQGGIFLTSLSGSTPRQLTTPATARGEIGHVWPHALPGGRTFLYFVKSNVDSVRGVYLGSVDSPRGQRVVASPASAVYSNGYLLYVHDGALVAQRFNVTSGSLAGERMVIADSVATSFEYYGAFTASQNGVLVFAGGHSRDISRLEWRDTTGAFRGTVSAPGVRNPDLSADGRNLAFETYRATLSDIRYVDLATGVSSVLPDENAQALVPVWSPDGASLAFVAEQPGGFAIYRKQINRSDAPKVLFRVPRHPVLSDWSGGDEALILAEQNEAGDYDLVARRFAALDEPVILAAGPGHQAAGRVAPAGNYLAYVSKESGEAQIYAQKFPVTGVRCQVSSDGGVQPVWGARPGELYFLSPNGTLMKAMLDLTRPAPCPASAPRALFPTPIRNPSGARSHFDVSLKDGRFLFNLPSMQDGGAWLSVIVNWLAALPKTQ